MSLYGKNTRAIRKKDILESRNTPIALANIMFWHQAVSGETGIDLGSLVIPPSVLANGNTNPSSSVLLAQNLFRYKDSVKVVSSVKGELTRSAFKISGNSRITFVGFTALEGEFFECTISPSIKNGVQVVDARIQTASGDLADGSTDFPIGFETPTNREESIVVRNGLVQTRNSSNSSTVQDGNYYVVDNGSGAGTVIRFNDPADGQDDAIFVTAVGNIIDSPSDSTFSALEVLQGQLDALVPTVAALAGVDETDFQANPNNIDQKQFGARVIDLENTKQDKFTNLVQTKILATDIIELNTVVGALTFNNLEIGKLYRVRMQAFLASPNGNNVSFSGVHDGNIICNISHEGDATNDDNMAAGCTSPAFVATATTVTFQTSGMVAGGSQDSVSGNGTLIETWAELEELPNTQLTTKWA